MLRPLKAKSFVLCVFSAFLLILSFPNFNFWIFAWFGFVPLFFAMRNKSKLKTFLLSYSTGILFWLGTIYWLIHVTLPGMIILVLYLALYFGLFGLILSAIRYPLSVSGLLLIPSIWVLLEYIRSYLFTGFPWALLGYSQYLNLPVIQIADITGAWGVSFLVMMVNVSVYQVCELAGKPVRGWRRDCKKIIVPCLLLVLSLGYGFCKIIRLHANPPTGTPIKISVIQGNIPQALKWNPEAKNYIIDKYLDLTREVVKGKPGLIIWPEASLPVVLEEEPLFFAVQESINFPVPLRKSQKFIAEGDFLEKVINFVKEVNAPLLFGAVTVKDGSYHNSALLVSRTAEHIARYDKLHLVPFGEYIPLRKKLRFLETVVPIGDFTAGKEYTIFRTRHNFAVLICFEDLFPQLAREFRKRGADFLVNITNDAWFGNSSSPYQHFAASVFRAVENRLPVVRAANTGVSGFISPAGKIISLLKDKSGQNIFITGGLTESITAAKQGLTFYARFGDMFIAVCFLVTLCGIFLELKTKNV